MNEEIKKFATLIDQQLNPVLQEGKVYHSTYLRGSTGSIRASSGDLFYWIQDGFRKWDEESIEYKTLNEEILDDAMDKIVSSFPNYSKVNFTFKKGVPMKVELCTASELIQELKRDLADILREDYVHSFKTDIIFSNKEDGFISEFVHQELENEKRKIDFFPSLDYSLDEILPCLFNSLNEKIQHLHIEGDSSTVLITSNPAFPEIGLEECNNNLDVSELDSNSIEAIYEWLESFDENKINYALEVLLKKQDFKEMAESRYLNLIQARLNDKNATLKDFPKAALTFKEFNKITDKYHIGSNFISFTYMNDQESKLVIDTLGAIVANVLNVNEIIEQLKEVKSEEELKSFKDKLNYCDKISAYIEEQTELSVNGWWSKICLKVHSLILDKVMFEKTSFSEANKSLVLKEYMLLIDSTNDLDVMFDIHQSDTPDLTEVFWIFDNIPNVNWSDTSVRYPESPLDFTRKGQMRIGDFGKWEEIIK